MSTALLEAFAEGMPSRYVGRNARIGRERRAC